MIRKSSLTNQRGLQTMKIQSSEDSKRFKTKKSENSVSPFRKQILLTNKENVHPNINLKYQGNSQMEEFIYNKLYANSPLSQDLRCFKGSSNINNKQEKYPYYALKHQSLNKKIQTICQKQKNKPNSEYPEVIYEKKVQKKKKYNLEKQKKIGRCYQKKQLSRQKNKGMLSPIFKEKQKNSGNTQNKYEKKKYEKLKQNKTNFVINLQNRELGKCQLFHHWEDQRDHRTPKAAYLINCRSDFQIQFLCCQQCATKFEDSSNRITKILIESIVGNKDEIQLEKYLQNLYKKSECLQQIRKNLVTVEKEFRQMCDREEKKHRNHYNTLLQIIQESMNKSQSILAASTNEGYSILNEKVNETEGIIHQINKQIQNIITIKKNRNKNYSASKQSYDCISEQVITEILNSRSETLELPIISINSQIQEISSNFKQLFDQQFAIKIFSKTEKQIYVNQTFSQYNGQQQQKNDQFSSEISINGKNLGVKDCQQRLSTKSNLINQQRNSYDKTLDIFCDETVSPNDNFSFQGNQQNTLNIRPDQCIVELVDEEDVISPVFKVI